MSAAVSSSRHRTRRRHRRGLGLVLVGAVTMVGSASMAVEGTVTSAGSMSSEGPLHVSAVTAHRVVSASDGIELPDALEKALGSDAERGGSEPQPAPERAPEPTPEPSSPVDAPDLDAAVADPEPADADPRLERWEELARCESGNNWSIDTGNGYYGGLQFDHRSWHWAGGDRYSDYPHHATKTQQIEIAERLLDMHPSGWGAWPACSAELGFN